MTEPLRLNGPEASSRSRAAAHPIRSGDRRGRARLPLHWAVKIIRADGSLLRSVTENLSSSGFYCWLGDRIGEGEAVDCQLSIPSNRVTDIDRPVAWLCRARVVRVEIDGEGRCGAGLAIEQYQILPEG